MSVYGMIDRREWIRPDNKFCICHCILRYKSIKYLIIRMCKNAHVTCKGTNQSVMLSCREYSTSGDKITVVIIIKGARSNDLGAAML